MDIQTQQTELKRLMIKGKDQGFLTYSEINDHLPEGMNDTDQIESVVNMINDMGIDVLDSAPDPDSLLLKTTNDEEEVVEEAEAVLTSAVESEFGRTTDPVRMYMREMGTVDLLTRQDEINLAKRIEDGIRQSISAIATCPLVIEEVIRLGDRLEEGKLKLPELLVGFVDPNADNDVILPGAQPARSDPAQKKSRNISIKSAPATRVLPAHASAMGSVHPSSENTSRNLPTKCCCFVSHRDKLKISPGSCATPLKLPAFSSGPSPRFAFSKPRFRANTC